MEKRITLLCVLSAMALLASCSSTTSTSTKTSKNDGSYSGGADTSVATDASAFKISTSDGEYTAEDGIYTITKHGTYTLSGTLVGQIFVNVDETDADEEVELDLSSVSISYEGNSPIYVKSANEVKIKAIKGTSNTITDLRAAEDSSSSDNQGAGAIYAKTDLKLVGAGTLNVTGTFNNGVHSTKDLKIKNQTLNVAAPGNAIKGSNSLTIESGTITAISTLGDALKTSENGTSSSGKQQGTLSISGGTLDLYAACDGIDAAYDAVISTGTDDDGNATSPSISIHTDKYSSYSAATSVAQANVLNAPGGGFGPGGGGGFGPGGGGDSGNTNKSEDSAKGIKAANSVQISGGSISIQAYDDGVHADYGDAFESGKRGVGDVIISGGTLDISASDDGVHASRYLRISGGTVNISTAYEGLEGNQIYISGGEMDIYATNDGVNAGNSDSMAGLTPYLEVSGGYLYAAVPSSGDVDCIDSNGTYKQTGGVVIACGPSSEMAAALDTDGSVNVSGGTLLLFGTSEKTPSKGSGVTSSSLSGSWGNRKSYTVTFSSGSTITTKTFPSYTYSRANCWSTYGSLSTIK